MIYSMPWMKVHSSSCSVKHSSGTEVAVSTPWDQHNALTLCPWGRLGGSLVKYSLSTHLPDSKGVVPLSKGLNHCHSRMWSLERKP